MAFRATLSFAGKEFDVLDCTYSLKRDVDSKGRPSSNIYGGQIRLHVESTDDTSILENIDIVGSQPMTITFVVSAQVIKIGGAQFEQNWPK